MNTTTENYSLVFPIWLSRNVELFPRFGAKIPNIDPYQVVASTHVKNMLIKIASSSPKFP